MLMLEKKMLRTASTTARTLQRNSKKGKAVAYKVAQAFAEFIGKHPKNAIWVGLKGENPNQHGYAVLHLTTNKQTYVYQATISNALHSTYTTYHYCQGILQITLYLITPTIPTTSTTLWNARK